QLVRNYTPDTDAVVVDTLIRKYQRTFYGEASAVVDPNGWLTKLDYDYNGRMNTAWMPGDFMGNDTGASFYAWQQITMSGESGDSLDVDSLRCQSGGVDSNYHPTNYFPGVPQVGWYRTARPVCPCGPGESEKRNS